MIGQRRISIFDMKCTRRPDALPTAQPRSGGSKFEQWLATTMNAASRGMWSVPSMRAPKKTRPRKPAMAAPGWKNQLRTDQVQARHDGVHALLDIQFPGVDHERAGGLAQRR